MKQEPKKIERIFYTFQEAQEFLNISHQTIYELMKQGLSSHKIGRNGFSYPVDKGTLKKGIPGVRLTNNASAGKGKTPKLFNSPGRGLKIDSRACGN